MEPMRWSFRFVGGNVSEEGVIVGYIDGDIVGEPDGLSDGDLP